MPKTASSSKRNSGDAELGRRIEALLARNKHLNNGGAKTRSDLAIAAGVSPTAAGKWVRTGAIAREQLVPICRALRCSADELLGLRKIGTAAAEPFDLDALVSALEFVDKTNKMKKSTMSYGEKAQLLLDVLALENSAG